MRIRVVILAFFISCIVLQAEPAGAQQQAAGAEAAANAIPATPTAGAPIAFSAALSPDDLPTPKHTGIKALFRNLGGDFKALPSVPNLWIAGIGGAAALAVHPFDDNVNESLQGAGDFFNLGQHIGSAAFQVGGALTTYAVGRIGHKPKASHVGMDLLRAQILSQAMTQGIKLAVRRERPDGTKYAFPSGHASVTVATALVIDRHFGIAWSLPFYGMAAYVGASRMHDNRHWLSDVVFGSAVGAIAGRTVTRHGKSNFTFMPAYEPGQVALLITRDLHHQ